MAWVFHRRDADLAQADADFLDTVALAHPLPVALLEMLDRGARAGGDMRRQGRREDEARREAANEINQRLRPGDIAADNAKGLAQRAFDDCEAVHQAFALGNAAAMIAVEADGVDFVEISHRAKLIGDVAELLDRSDIAVHRVDAFEGDQFRGSRIKRGDLLAQVAGVIVTEDDALGAGVADAFDH